MSDSPFLDEPSAEPEWQTPAAGMALTPAEVAVSKSYQAQKLAACGIDPAIFAQTVDPSFFIGIGIHAGIRSGISAQGNVNMLQQLIQYRPVALAETLVVKGQIEAIESVPRGQRVYTTVSFEDAHGNVVVNASRTSLKPDPERFEVRGAGERPAPVVKDPRLAKTITSHQLTAQRVKDYSTEGNSIHYDEAAAQAAGFRAPMIGGGMGVHYLAAALWDQGTPQQLDLDIYFRRPIFWDETFTCAGLHRTAQDAQWQALCLLRDEADKGLKVLTEARVNQLTP